jgi:hypothetical protein
MTTNGHGIAQIWCGVSVFFPSPQKQNCRNTAFSETIFYQESLQFHIPLVRTPERSMINGMGAV